MLSKMLIARQQLRNKKVASKHNIRSDKKISIPSIWFWIIPNFQPKFLLKNEHFFISFWYTLYYYSLLWFLVFIRTILIELEFLIILQFLVLSNTLVDISRHTVPFYNQFVLLNYMIYSQKRRFSHFFLCC